MALYDRVQRQYQSKTPGRITPAHIRYVSFQPGPARVVLLQRDPNVAVVLALSLKAHGCR